MLEPIEQVIEFPENFWEEVHLATMCRSRWLDWGVGVYLKLFPDQAWRLIPTEETVAVTWYEPAPWAGKRFWKIHALLYRFRRKKKTGFGIFWDKQGD